MTQILNRPQLSTETVDIDVQKFINYVRGKDQINTFMMIPGTMVGSIESKLRVLSPIRALAKVVQTRQDRVDVVLDKNPKDSTGWVSDQLIKPDNQPPLKKISIYLHQLYAKPRVTSTMLEDSETKVDEVIQETITSQMAVAENHAFLYGNGITQPKGILSSEIKTEGYEPTDNAFEGMSSKLSEFTSQHIIQLMEHLPAKYLYGAVWLMPRSVASHIRLMKDGNGGRFIWQNSIINGVPDTLLGYPVVICDDLPKISEKANAHILFGNFQEAYQIAEHSEIKLLKDPYNSKPYVEFYATKRLGGEVLNFEALKAFAFIG